MKKIEAIYRDILYRTIEQKEFRLTQLELAKKLGISLSIVNSAVKRLNSIGAVKINQRSLDVVDIRKILYFWASMRNLEKDIIFSIRVEAPVKEIERSMPNVLFTGYTAYKLRFNDVPADYSEVYVYADEAELDEIKKRLPFFKISEKSKLNDNFFVLRKDSFMKLYKTIPIGQIFVDLWNLNKWYSKDFILAFDKEIEKIGVL